MKANRKFVEEKEAVSAVIGVILMVAITVAIAATVYVYVSGMLGGTPTNSATVGMVSKSGYVQITGVENGPVATTSCTLKAINSTGVNVAGSAVTLTGNYAGSNVAGGDTITVTAGTASPGDVFNIEIVTSTNVLGEVQYTMP